jgi:hypothetical protein
MDSKMSDPRLDDLLTDWKRAHRELESEFDKYCDRYHRSLPTQLNLLVTHSFRDLVLAFKWPEKDANHEQHVHQIYEHTRLIIDMAGYIHDTPDRMLALKSLMSDIKAPPRGKLIVDDAIFILKDCTKLLDRLALMVRDLIPKPPSFMEGVYDWLQPKSNPIGLSEVDRGCLHRLKNHFTREQLDPNALRSEHADPGCLGSIGRNCTLKCLCCSLTVPGTVIIAYAII